MLSQQAQEVVQMLRTLKAQSIGSEQTPEKAIADREMISNLFGSMPIPENITMTVITEERVKGEWLSYHASSEVSKSKEILLFIHGGGFTTGSPMSRRQLCAGIIQKAKMDAFSVAYRQWPEAEHPAALEDCMNAYKWLLHKGYNAQDIHIFGESAGAMLTLTMLLYLKDHDIQMPKSATVFSPVAAQGIALPSHTDRDDRDPMIRIEHVIPYYAQSDLKSPYVSPMYGDYQGFPKLAIHVGTEEVLFDDALLIESLCKKAGVDVSLTIWEELFHVFPLFPCPETEQALQVIADFISQTST